MFPISLNTMKAQIKIMIELKISLVNLYITLNKKRWTKTFQK